MAHGEAPPSAHEGSAQVLYQMVNNLVYGGVLLGIAVHRVWWMPAGFAGWALGVIGVLMLLAARQLRRRYVETYRLEMEELERQRWEEARRELKDILGGLRRYTVRGATGARGVGH